MRVWPSVVSSLGTFLATGGCGSCLAGCAGAVVATCSAVEAVLPVVLLEEQPGPIARNAVSRDAEAAAFGFRFFMVRSLCLLAGGLYSCKSGGIE